MARILYIDDQEADLIHLESILKRAGHQVTLARDGFAGIALMRTQGFDLVITDAIMPGGVSGFEVTRTIRNQVGPDKLPIILLTGRKEKRDVEKAIEAGVSDYVIKPVEPESFLAKIAAAVEMKERRAEAVAREIPVAEVAFVTISLNVTGLNERGVTLRASQPLRVGADLDLGAAFYKKIGLNIVPNLVVSACDPESGHQFRIEATFIDLDPTAVNALRLWVTFNRSRRMG